MDNLREVWAFLNTPEGMIWLTLMFLLIVLMDIRSVLRSYVMMHAKPQNYYNKTFRGEDEDELDTIRASSPITDPE